MRLETENDQFSLGTRQEVRIAHAIGVGYSLARSQVLGRTTVSARKRVHSNGFFLKGRSILKYNVMEHRHLFSASPSKAISDGVREYAGTVPFFSPSLSLKQIQKNVIKSPD